MSVLAQCIGRTEAENGAVSTIVCYVIFIILPAVINVIAMDDTQKCLDLDEI